MTNNTITTLEQLATIKTDLNELVQREKEAFAQFEQVLATKGPTCSHKMYKFLTEFIDIVSQTQSFFSINSENWSFEMTSDGLYTISYCTVSVKLKTDCEEVYIQDQPVYQSGILQDMIREWEAFSTKLIDTASSYIIEKIFNADRAISSYHRKIDCITNFIIEEEEEEEENKASVPSTSVYEYYVNGKVTITITGETEKEKIEKAEQFMCEADFGPLEDIEWTEPKEY